jgi:ABC-type Fe3+-siderophore transport system permease subunit
MGFLSFFVGGIITIWLIIEKLLKMNSGDKYRQVTDQPLFYIALVAIIVGVQLFVAGFLGELISRNSADRNTYQVDQQIGI